MKGEGMRGAPAVVKGCSIGTQALAWRGAVRAWLLGLAERGERRASFAQRGPGETACEHCAAWVRLWRDEPALRSEFE